MNQETQAFVTTIIAVYGAVLGTISLITSVVLGIIEIKRYKPKLKVAVSYGVITDGRGHSSEPLMLIKALNIGHGKIVLQTFGFLLKDKSTQIMMKP